MSGRDNGYGWSTRLVMLLALVFVFAAWVRAVQVDMTAYWVGAVIVTAVYLAAWQWGLRTRGRREGIRSWRLLPDTMSGVPNGVVMLSTALVARYRAVDREQVGSALVDTPMHLAALTDDIAARGILVPLRLAFNDQFATLDGNHRIAVALRLGLDGVPVTLVRVPTHSRPGHARAMRPDDLLVIEQAFTSGR